MPIAPGVDIQNLQQETRAGLLTAMSDLQKAGVNFQITSAYRPSYGGPHSQDAQYQAYKNRGFTGLPAAPPGHSAHESGQAVDISLADPSQRQVANQILAQHGFSWFGPGDHVHYTYTGPGLKNASAPADPVASFRSGPSPAASAPPRDAISSFRSSPAPTPVATPAHDPISSFRSTAPAAASTGHDPISSFRSAPAPSLAALGTPGNPRRSGGGMPAAPAPEQVAALSYPRHVATGGNAPVQTDPNIQAQQQVDVEQQAAPITGPIQRGLNRAMAVGVTIPSVFMNNLAKEMGKQHAQIGAGHGVGFMPDVTAIANAAKATPWSKLFVSGLIKGESAAFPTPTGSFGEGAKGTPLGGFIARNPIPTGVLDFVLSFPLLEIPGAVQSRAVGLAGQGLRVAGEATGVVRAGERVGAKIPWNVKNLAGLDPTTNALTETLNKNVAGFERFYHDTANVAEDSRVTSQKYKNAGADIAYKSPHTGQPVNRFEELVADWMDAGNKGSKYEELHPNPHQVVQDAKTAETMHGVLTRAKGSVPGIVAAGPEGIAWSKAANELRAELGTPYAIPAETGAGKTLSGITAGAKGLGARIVRENAYNEAGTAAQQAAHAQQRTAELGTVAQAASEHGIDPADVKRVADGYSRIFDNLGQHLVDMGLMKPEAYANLKGQYLPRLYLLTKGNPGDIDAFLKFLDSEGALTSEAVTAAQKQGLTQRWARGVGPKSFTQSRELASFGEMNAAELARARVPEATPAALHGIEAQAKAAGLASGMKEIAQNPEWAAPLENGNLPTGKEHWVPYAGKGPLEGMAVHPAIAELLKAQTSPGAMRQLAVSLFGEKRANAVVNFNRGYRKAMLSGPSTIANIIIGHGWFTHAGAADAGTHFGPFEYANALRDIRDAARGKAVDPFLDEVTHKTDLMSRGGSILPKTAKSVSGGVGLETPLQNVGRVVKGGFTKYLNLTHDLLAGGKYGLYKQLRLKGYSIDDAARLTRNATINYTNLPTAIRVLDQGMFAPFLTFSYRALPLAGKMALKRPDIFASASGSRLNYYLDRMADKVAESRGQQGQAVAARASGAVGPATFALPGLTDHGQQRYLSAPLGAPLLHHYLHGQVHDIGQELAEPIMSQVRNAFPLFQTLRGALTNQDVSAEKPRQIVPSGSLPPDRSIEYAGEIGRWMLGRLAPPAAGLMRVGEAYHGTTPFASRSTAPQTPMQAWLQFATGSRVGTASHLMPAGQAPPGATVRGGQRDIEMVRQMKAAGGFRYGQVAMDRFKQLVLNRKGAPPNAGYAERAGRLPDIALRDEVKTAIARLPDVVYGSKYTGADRAAATDRMVTWVFTLAHEMENRHLKPPYKEIAFAIGYPLAAMRNAP